MMRQLLQHSRGGVIPSDESFPWRGARGRFCTLNTRAALALAPCAFCVKAAPGVCVSVVRCRARACVLNHHAFCFNFEPHGSDQCFLFALERGRYVRRSVSFGHCFSASWEKCPAIFNGRFGWFFCGQKLKKIISFVIKNGLKIGETLKRLTGLYKKSPD